VSRRRRLAAAAIGERLGSWHSSRESVAAP
jgi:hypothetical protein